MFHNAALKRTALGPFDWTLFSVAAGLLGFGLVMVYSASIALSFRMGEEPHGFYFLTRQFIYAGLGILAGWMAYQVPAERWQKVAPAVFAVAVVALILVLVPVIGKTINGSQRWITLGPLGNFQSSELMKLATILYAADYTVRKASHMHSLQKGFLPMLLVMVGISALLQMQPDLGATVVIIAIAMGILFLGGLNLRLFVLLLLLVLAGVALLIWMEPYRLTRLTSYADPWKDPLGTGFQVTHALMAIGRGGWLGEGIGNSVDKLHYLPEAHTDFILAVIGEETGLVGIFALLAVYAWISWRAFSIGWQASLMGRNFCALAAQGVGLWIGVQAFFNIGVNVALLPPKGLTLPLISYGGSGLVMNLLALALLLRIDAQNRQMMRGGGRG